MSLASADLPSDPDALRAFALACQSELAQATAELQAARLAVQLRTLEIEKLKFQLAKLRRMQFGRSSERVTRQIEQLELRLEELEAGEAEAISQGRQRRPAAADPPEKPAQAQEAAGPSAPARGRARTGARRRLHLSGLRRRHGQARRRCHRGARLYPRAVSGNPPCPAEICLPVLRCDHPGAGAGSADAARARRTRHARASLGVKIYRSLAALSAEPDLCARRARSRPLDPRFREGRL